MTGGAGGGRGAAAPAARLSLSVGPAGTAAGAARRSYRFDRLPLRVGPGARCELRLDPPGLRGREAGRGPQRPWFEIHGQGGEACLAAEDPLLVNGVLQRRKVLRPGDRITCGVWRISLDEVVLVQAGPARPGEGRPAAPRSGPGLIRGLGVFLCLLAAGLALALPLWGGGAADGRLQPAAAVPAAGDTPDPFPPGPDPAAVEMVPPGEEPAAGRADILLFHAHPDDESLEYGGLAARASRSGLRVAAVLFSDGEGGQDRWPERGAGGIYPARRLRGKTLALVRVQEARRALAALGARAYVRLGRRNHAYEGPGQALDLRQTLADWGGEEALVARVRRLIETCRPALVVAPDSPSAAREHFEHQAAGRVVARAVEEVRRAGSVPLRGFLVPVDPFQRALYPSSFGLPVGADRGAQALALRQHQTQRAAAVIGLETLTSLPHEYYQAVFWSDGAGRSPPAAIEEWLGP